jgi:hypothetical protein
VRQPFGIGDPYSIPTATDKRVQLTDGESYFLNGVSGENCPIKGVKFRWLTTLDQRRFADFTRTYGSRPGYTITGAGLKGPELAQLVEELGLPPSYIDIARGRIAYAEYVLAHIPIEEVVLRLSELSEFDRKRRTDMDEAHMAALERKGIKPVRKQMGEFHSEKEFHNRSGKPFVSFVPAPQGG